MPCDQGNRSGRRCDEVRRHHLEARPRSVGSGRRIRIEPAQGERNTVGRAGQAVVAIDLLASHGVSAGRRGRRTACPCRGRIVVAATARVSARRIPRASARGHEARPRSARRSRQAAGRPSMAPDPGLHTASRRRGASRRDAPASAGDRETGDCRQADTWSHFEGAAADAPAAKSLKARAGPGLRLEQPDEVRRPRRSRRGAPRACGSRPAGRGRTRPQRQRRRRSRPPMSRRRRRSGMSAPARRSRAGRRRRS